MLTTSPNDFTLSCERLGRLGSKLWPPNLAFIFPPNSAKYHTLVKITITKNQIDQSPAALWASPMKTLAPLLSLTLVIRVRQFLDVLRPVYSEIARTNAIEATIGKPIIDGIKR